MNLETSKVEARIAMLEADAARAALRQEVMQLWTMLGARDAKIRELEAKIKLLESGMRS